MAEEELLDFFGASQAPSPTDIQSVFSDLAQKIKKCYSIVGSAGLYEEKTILHHKANGELFGPQAESKDKTTQPPKPPSPRKP